MNYNVDKRVLTGRWLYPGQEALFKRLGNYSADTDGDNVFEVFAEKPEQRPDLFRTGMS